MKKEGNREVPRTETNSNRIRRGVEMLFELLPEATCDVALTLVSREDSQGLLSDEHWQGAWLGVHGGGYVRTDATSIEATAAHEAFHVACDALGLFVHTASDERDRTDDWRELPLSGKEQQMANRITAVLKMRLNGDERATEATRRFRIAWAAHQKREARLAAKRAREDEQYEREMGYL